MVDTVKWEELELHSGDMCEVAKAQLKVDRWIRTSSDSSHQVMLVYRRPQEPLAKGQMWSLIKKHAMTISTSVVIA